MTWKFVRNVFIKALGLFILLSLLIAAWDPAAILGRVSLYNAVFPGRPRFPFGENPQKAYNFTLNSFPAMFTAHEIHASQPKPPDEFRIIVIGDSSTWGTLLRPGETLAGQLNALNLTTCDGLTLRAYNLGYPTLSLVKDLLVLQMALPYQPDLVLWPVTLESFPWSRQLESPILQANGASLKELSDDTGLTLDFTSLPQPNFWDRTLIGQRRDVADWFRLQFYGVMWSATGIDQDYPTDYDAAARDLEADPTFNGWQDGEMQVSDLAFEVLDAGFRLAHQGGAQVVFVNEPMLVSRGLNSDIRYNFYYPRWAYDQYRHAMNEHTLANGWTYLDLWDIVPENDFTNSAIHRTPAGERLFAEKVATALNESVCRE